MSSSDAAPGGYRNLRAMWENKAVDQSTSPPSRGRSPNGSTTSLQERSPEKVRASFIAVERAAEDNQTQPTVFKSSNSTMDGTSEQSLEDNQGLGDILKGSPFLDEGMFPTKENTESKSNGVADRAAAMVKKMQTGDTNPPPIGEFVDPSAGTPIPKSGPHRLKPQPNVEPTKSSTNTPEQPPTPKGPIVKPKGGVAKIKGVMESAARAKEEQEAPTESTKPPSTPEGPIVKPRGGVSKIQGVMESAARAKEEREAVSNEAKQSEQDVEPPGVTETSSKASEEQPALAQEHTSTNGVTKMQQNADSDNKPNTGKAVASSAPPSKAASQKSATVKDSAKSLAPARPARTSLPVKKASAPTAAPTTSSATKNDESKKVAKVPLRVAATGTASSLAKKSSRASLNNNDSTKSRSTTKPADEGFLARMMRPTASSAQKTHEKVQVSSPPRPRQTSTKTLAPKASRRSLIHSDDYKENVTENE